MFEMKPEYYIGIKMIDEQHKQLFAYAEEAYMESIHYKKLFTQKVQHQAFIEILVSLTY